MTEGRVSGGDLVGLAMYAVLWRRSELYGRIREGYHVEYVVLNVREESAT